MHTKGPWMFAPTGEVMAGYSQPFGIAEAGKANLVAGVFGDVSGGLEVAEANARLIAAAPELLAALRGLVQCHDDWNREIEKLIGWPVNWSPTYLDAAKAAIAKAEGQQ